MVGVILWEAWDHHSVKKEGKPIMRNNLQDYLKEIKNGLLYDETGIMYIIDKLNYNIISSIENNER